MGTLSEVIMGRFDFVYEGVISCATCSVALSLYLQDSSLLASMCPATTGMRPGVWSLSGRNTCFC